MKTGSEILADLPFRWGTQGKIFIIGGLGYMFDAWDVVLTGFLLPLLTQSDWDLSTFQLGVFGSAALAGMAVGAFVWGSIADLVGRRRVFTLTMLVFSIFSLLSAIAPSFTWLLIFRFISGLGLGGCLPVDYSLVSEFMTRRTRGVFLTMMNIFWPIGATLNGVVATILLPYHNWRLLFLIMVIPALLVFWVRRGIPESPLFLAHAGKHEEADNVLKLLAKQTKAKLPDQWVWKEKPKREKRNLLLELVEQFKSIWVFNWKITLAVWLIFLSNLLLYYGVLTWLPSILVKEGFSNYGAYIAATSMTAIGIAGNLLSAWFVKIWGRKPMIVLGGLLGGISMVVFTYQLHTPSAAHFWILFFGFTIELVIPALNTYAPEVYPTEIRGTGFGWASTLSRIGAGFVPIIFGSFLWPIFGLENTFLTILIFVAVSVIFMFFVTPETKDSALDDSNINPQSRELPKSASREL